MNIAWWVKRWSELAPNKCALIFAGNQISYLELHRRTNRMSRWLRSLDIRKGDRVAVMLRNCPESIELYIACSRLGAIFVPINWRLTTPELEYLLRNAQPKVFVFEKGFSKKVTTLNQIIPHSCPVVIDYRCGSDEHKDYGFSQGDFANQDESPDDQPAISNQEEPHVIMYTSGTTGQPKGAILSHRKTFFNCLNADIFFQLNFDDVMLIVLPLFHSGGLFIQASPMIYKGGTMVLHSKFDPLKVYEDIERFKVTKFLGVPTVYRALLAVEQGKRDKLSSLRVGAIGGEKTTPELLRQCTASGFPLRQIMGQTETSILLWASEEDALRKPGSVGRPVLHAEVDLFDHQGRSVKIGEPGEIVVRGPIIMNAYWRASGKTRETIKGGWLYTGDLARMDEDGYFYLVGRAKNMYVSGGENVYPTEVERILREHPAVEDAAVIGIPDEQWGEIGHAFIIPKNGWAMTPEELLSYCEGKLAHYKWPRRVSFRSKFPRTSLGKVRKTMLLEEDASR